MTRGARGEVAGDCLGTLSLLWDGMPTRLNRLLCWLANLGLPFSGGVLLPLPRLGRWLLDRDFCDESVVGGECLSKNELNVEDDLFCRTSSLVSLLEVLPEELLVSFVL